MSWVRARASAEAMVAPLSSRQPRLAPLLYGAQKWPVKGSCCHARSRVPAGSPIHTSTRQCRPPAEVSVRKLGPDSRILPSAVVQAAQESVAPSLTPRVQLRPYQELAVAECLAAISEGTTRVGVSSPTGSGKTTMFTELIARLPDTPSSSKATTLQSASRVLIVVNSTELASQAASAVSRAHPHLLVEIEQGTKFHATGLADVTVATYQSLMRNEKRLEKYSPDAFKAVIVDEAHHAASPSYIALLSRFNSQVGMTRSEREEAAASGTQYVSELHHEHNVPIIGFSATFSRHDGLALGRVFDRIVFHQDFLSMIEEKWLCPVRFTSIKSDLDLSSVSISRATGDFAPRSLSKFANVPAINRLIVRTWLDRASSRRSTLIFCIDVEHTKALTAEFRQAGIDARYLHGGTAMKERKQLLQDFKDGEFKVLINCAILTEGFDLPQIDTVVLARPTRSRNLFSQMIGRGLRQSHQTGKEDCLVLDLVGSIDRGVICTPTLFGLDPSDPIDNASIEDLKEWAEERRNSTADREMDQGDEVLDPEKITFIDYESPHELQAALIQRGEGHITRLSPNAWVDCGGDMYILNIPHKGFIRVMREDDKGGDTDAAADLPSTGLESSEQWIATFTPENVDAHLTGEEGGSYAKSSPYRRPINISGTMAAPDLETCVRTCDTYALRKVLHVQRPDHPLLRRDAAWRKQPATPSQKTLVANRIGYKAPQEQNGLGSLDDLAKRMAQDDMDRTARNERLLQGLTKGKASDILTKLKFGFRKRWQDNVKAKNRAVAARIKELKKLERQTVKVGAL